MSEPYRTFRVAYLIRHVDKYSIFGFPGVALDRLCRRHDPKSYRQAMKAYGDLEKSRPSIRFQDLQTVGELRTEVVRLLTPEPLHLDERFTKPLRIWTGCGLCTCMDDDIPIGSIMSAIPTLGEVYATILLRNIAGEITELRGEGMTYSIHSNERGKHHDPHVHVKHAEHEASIQIGNGKLLDGSLPHKQLKKATDTAIAYREPMLHRWNTESKGLCREPAAYFQSIGVERGTWPEGMKEEFGLED